MSRNRPPATQGEILRLLEEGWELGVDSTFAASIWLQKDGLGRGGETREVNGSSFSALKRKGLIWQIKYGFPSSLWGLIKTPALPVKYD